MLTIHFEMDTNVKDVIGYPTALEVCGKAFADHISSMLIEIKDPKTGESPRLNAECSSRGIKLVLTGSDHCKAEAEIRILTMLKPDWISMDEKLATALNNKR